MDSFCLLIGGEMTVGLYAVLTVIRRNRCRRTVLCPDSAKIVQLEIAAGRAVQATAPRVKWCSQGPRRKGCAEDRLANQRQPAGAIRRQENGNDASTD